MGESASVEQGSLSADEIAEVLQRKANLSESKRARVGDLTDAAVIWHDVFEKIYSDWQAAYVAVDGNMFSMAEQIYRALAAKKVHPKTGEFHLGPLKPYGREPREP